MNERFAFDDICICVFGYFVSAYFCIFVQNSYLYFICVCHNHHHLVCSSTLLFMRAKEREIRSFRLHYDDGNIFLFISVAEVFGRFQGIYDSEWVILKRLDEASSKFGFQNTCKKVKSDFQNRFELRILMIYFFGSPCILW